MRTTLYLLVALIWSVRPASAQCPPNSGDPTWPAGSTVYYDLSGLPNDTDLRNQMRAAFQKWTTANQSNASNITFTEGTGGARQISFNVGPAEINGVNYAAKSGSSWNSGGVTSQTIELNLNNVGDNFYDANARQDYLTFILKVGLHEIGHPMGLGNAPGPGGTLVAGASVMNPWTMPNDTGGGVSFGATDLTSCDNNIVWSIFNYETVPEPYQEPGSVEEAGGWYSCTFHYNVTHYFYWDGNSYEYWFSYFDFQYYDNCYPIVCCESTELTSRRGPEHGPSPPLETDRITRAVIASRAYEDNALSAVLRA